MNDEGQHETTKTRKHETTKKDLICVSWFEVSWFRGFVVEEGE